MSKQEAAKLLGLSEKDIDREIKSIDPEEGLDSLVAEGEEDEDEHN